VEKKVQIILPLHSKQPIMSLQDNEALDTSKVNAKELSDNVLNHKENLQKYDGVKGLAKILGSDLERGLPDDEQRLESIRKEFGSNRPKEKRKKGFFSFVVDAMKDKTLIILSVAAVVSIALGLTVEDRTTGWIDGTAILVAVIIIVAVTAGNDYNKEKKFQKLSEIRDEKKVSVIRGGQKKEISTFDIVVGDIVEIESGASIPADGVLIWGEDVSVDESSMTGESDSVDKSEDEPFLLSGCTILSGVVKCLVIAVGENSQWGKLSQLLEGPNEDTPLTKKLERLAENIGKAGLVAAILLLAVLLIQWGVAFKRSGRAWEWSEAGTLLSFLIQAIALIVMAIPEGLPLSVALSLSYSMIKMTKDQNLVRHLEACETMGGATNICSDKTGTLTENKMTVTRVWLAGVEWKSEESQKSAEKEDQQIKLQKDRRGSGYGNVNREYSLNSIPEEKESEKKLSPQIEELFVEGIYINSSAYLAEKDGKTEVVGNKTEGALISFLKSGKFIEAVDSQQKREENHSKVEKMYPFNSDNKTMSTLIKLNGEGQTKHRLYTKGAAEIVIGNCSNVLDFEGSRKIDDHALSELKEMVDDFANEGLRAIALAFIDMDEPPVEEESSQRGEGSSKKEKKHDSQGKKRTAIRLENLCLIGFVGIKDPLRAGVKGAVSDCQKAGIMVRMLTGDNVLTASHIARECGILTESGVALDGEKFRNMAQTEMDEVLPKLQVLARMTPQDKFILVHRLRELGEVVAVTGDGVNDAPQLKEADVGFAMGSGTEVAKDACDIVLMDDNFSSLVKSVMWGRNVYDSIRKFVQFQLTVNIVAVIFAFVGAITTGQSALTAVQLLWVNLIMDTFAALALATEQPTKELLNRNPYGRNDSLITRIMWRNIIGQATFQLIILVLLYYFIHLISFFGLPSSKSDFTPTDHAIANTILFNTFVLCQLFNEINSRSLTNNLNIFKGILKNYIFLGIMAVTIVVQFVMVQFAGSFADTHPLNWSQWLACIVIAFITLPYGLLLRLVVRIKDREPVRNKYLEMKEEKGKEKGKEKEKEKDMEKEGEKIPLMGREREQQSERATQRWRSAKRKMSVVSAFRNPERTSVRYPSKASYKRRSSFLALTTPNQSQNSYTSTKSLSPII